MIKHLIKCKEKIELEMTKVINKFLKIACQLMKIMKWIINNVWRGTSNVTYELAWEETRVDKILLSTWGEDPVIIADL